MLALAVFLVAAAQKGTDYSQAELLSSVISYRPGQSFLVGIRIKIKPSWHVYWRNPGDSGSEVRAKWVLPKGWKASEIMWPGPKAIIDTGIVNYGYEGDPTFLVRLTPTGSGKAVVTANLEWLVCDKEMCLPAKKTLDLYLSSSPSQLASSNMPVLSKAEASLPKLLPSGLASATFTPKGIDFRARVVTEEGATYRFFPSDPALIANQESQTFESNGKWIEGKFPKSQYLTKKPARLKGNLLVSQPSPSLHNFYYAIDVPLK